MTALASLLLSVLLPLSAQDAPKADTDAARVLGTWSATLRTPEGTDLPVTVEFKDARSVIVVIKTDTGDEFKLDGEYKLDAKVSPKTLDFVNFATPNGDSMPDSLGVYEFKDDELRVRTGGPGGARPAKVGDSSDPEHFMVMKRLSKPKTGN